MLRLAAAAAWRASASAHPGRQMRPARHRRFASTSSCSASGAFPHPSDILGAPPLPAGSSAAAGSCSSCGVPAGATLQERQLRCLLRLAEHHTARRVEQRLGSSYAKPLTVRRLQDLLQLAPVGQEYHLHCSAGLGHGSCSRLHHALEAEAEAAARVMVDQEVPKRLVQVIRSPAAAPAPAQRVWLLAVRACCCRPFQSRQLRPGSGQQPDSHDQAASPCR
jgi:hypothetical protein